MRKAPPWLVEYLTAQRPAGPSLWVGPALAFPEALGVTVHAGELEELPEGGSFGAVFVASVEGALPVALGALRKRCAPGAGLVLLLPQPGEGMRGTFGALFGPLGRKGRKPRPLAEQCGALLSVGALDIGVVALEGQRRCVVGRLPESPLPLDGEFEKRAAE